ncbi:hypothetical protein RHGRI_013914 [Rhododendron griersonianum]|uniref:non-specific serine/threonine protein kinase n=1 Tax=Rhododendron griersonianum TaxID=479676 RepID=A0AAV6K7Q2_9ERIC|nr:hypothetical protein RHGRI_013914 [Rhododendron griersonianum]
MSNCNGVSLVLVARAVGLNWGWVGSWHLSRYPFVMSALNSVFSQWKIRPTYYQWNISGEPCNGAAIDTTVLWNIDSTDYNPGIRCDCNGTVCHITQLKVYALDVVGGIPEELWSLTSLYSLNLALNYLTGPLSPSIANLTQMQYLSLGINVLSGEVPKELGKLTNLIVLSISTNNFSGSLPSELGNLVKLERFYFDSSGVSGAIPSTFAALQNLSRVWGSNNELTGSIPGFIGSWSKLSSLRFQGNAFESGIPSTFSKLTSLTDLRISELPNGSSSLAFLKDMTSLSTLILRNNNISGTIPSNIGDYQSLSQLDVSYNQLLAELPSWANNSVMATGSDCIQQNFPCLGGIRSSPKYSNFAINCGGPEITSSSQIVYEWDNETLGPATYYETNTKRWAVSNVGHSNDINNPQYTSVSSSQVITNSDSRLFHTARISPGSLRYFGLGLENGNYSVTLYFAETEFLNPPSWKSLGRRVFDIYIQAWHVHENNSEVELVDARLLEFDEEEVKRVIGVALLCTQTSPQQRPSMPRVVAMLSGDIEVSAVTSRPGYFTDWNSDTTSFMTMDTPSAENEHSQFNACWGKVKMAADHDSEAWDFLLGLIQVSYKGYNSPFGSRNLHEYLVVVNVGWDKLVQDHDSEAWDFMLALSAT